MAIYDLGTASLSASGEVTGVGTTWKAPLTLIRVGATIVFKTEPVQIYTISEIISDTRINVYNPNSETVPAGTQYSILAHDGITVQGLAQDVSETLRYYQSRETEVAAAVDAFNQFDADAFQQNVTNVNNQSQQVATDAAQVASDKAQVQGYLNSAQQSAQDSQSSAISASSSAQQAANAAQSVSGALVGSFQQGVTIESPTQQVLDIKNGYSRSYIWGGSLPKVVPQGSTVESTGGYGSSAWIPVQDGLSRSFESFGAVGDGVTDDTASLESAFTWLEGAAFRKIYSSVSGARYLITRGLTMRFDGSYSQNIESTRYVDFTGSTIIAGYNNITCLKLSHDYCHVINPSVVVKPGVVDVTAYAIAPEDESQTTQRVSQQFCLIENPRAKGVRIGIKFKPGPTVGGLNSAAYYHTINNPNFVETECAFYFQRSVSGDNNNTRINIKNPIHVTGNCTFWIESTDSLRVFGGASENITTGTWPADVPCCVRVVKTVESDTQAAGNLKFSGFYGEVCTRAYLIDANVKTYNNSFDWGWIFITEPIRHQSSNDYQLTNEFDGCVLSSPWSVSGDQPAITGVRDRKTGNKAIMYMKDPNNPVQLYSDKGFTFTSPVITCPAQDLRNTNSDIQILGATQGGILLETDASSRSVTLTKYQGTNESHTNTGGDFKINGWGGFLPGQDNATILGYSSNRWSAVYSAEGTIQTSDGRLKQIEDISSTEISVGLRLAKSMVKYRWNDGGRNKKVHFGVIAQEIFLAFEEAGLNPLNYAVCEYDEENDIFGVNYAELSAFCLMALASKI